MYLARLAGLGNERHFHAQAALDEMMMNCTNREQRRDGQVVAAGHAIAEHEIGVAVENGALGLATNGVERTRQEVHAGRVVLDVEDGVDLDGLEVAILDVLDDVEVLEREYGMLEKEALALLATRLEYVRLGADGRRQRHDHLLADRIDRRIGDLSEELLEVVVDERIEHGEAGERRVVAHRAEALLGVLDHGQQEHAEYLGIVAEERQAAVLLHQKEVVLVQRCARAPRPAAGARRRAHRRAHDALEVGILRLEYLVQIVESGELLEPLLDRPHAAYLVLEVDVARDLLLEHVGEQDAAGLEAALLHNLGRIDVDHAHLARHDQVPRLGHVEARRTQTVAVEYGADVAAVGEREQSRPVPRLHGHRVPLVVGLLEVAHQLAVLPRLGHQRDHDLGQRAAAAHHQELDDVVERARVRQVLLHHRVDVLQLVAEHLAAHDALASVHEVHVAAQRVDLAVVRHVAEWMRALPARSTEI